MTPTGRGAIMRWRPGRVERVFHILSDMPRRAALKTPRSSNNPANAGGGSNYFGHLIKDFSDEWSTDSLIY
ncbi:MAG TPA: hypothetical protein VFU81_12775, partial [Thermomicrobiales bacterium]|nr:hypothetical protein [Thermomicrobiales bacterium]